MATQVVLRAIESHMIEAQVVTWHKKEGDRVSKGDVILEIMSEKIQYEVEAPESGILARIAVPEGETVPVGTVLALIAAEGEEITEDMLAAAPSEAAPSSLTPRADEAPAAGPKVAVPEGRVKVSPAARTLAGKEGISLEALTGSGPGGRIVLEDVERAVQARKAAPAAPSAKPAAAPLAPSDAGVKERIPLKGIRKTIYDRMKESWLGSPRVTQVMEIDMTEAVEFRKYNLPRWEKEDGVRVSFNDMIIRATALALKEHPKINSSIGSGEILIYENVNIGMAIATDEGLIVPVIHGADKLSLVQIAWRSKELADRARSGRLTGDDMRGRTFSITNLGSYNIDIFTPIINFPDSAILGVGRIAKRPSVIEDRVEIRSLMQICAVFNHQAVDGAPVAQFQSKIKELLEAPHLLL